MIVIGSGKFFICAKIIQVCEKNILCNLEHDR